MKLFSHLKKFLVQSSRYLSANDSVSISEMTWVIVGLGNPDEEHLRTRHNAGRMAVEAFAKAKGFFEWKEDKKLKSLVARGAVGRAMTVCVLPTTYMNKSGSAVMHFIQGLSAAERLIVVYDDLDLPIGTIKISFDRGSGGHKGVDSIMRTIKTRRFTRIRIGISRSDAEGAVIKTVGAKNVEDFVLGDIPHADLPAIQSSLKRAGEAIETIIAEGWVAAMNKFN